MLITHKMFQFEITFVSGASEMQEIKVKYSDVLHVN